MRLAILPCLLLAAPASAQDAVAVLAVETGTMEPAAEGAAAVAEAVRKELATSGLVVLSAEESRERMGGLGTGSRLETETYERRLKEAEDAFAALDTERSIEILEGVLRDLASDDDFLPAKQELLERSRVRAAARLMALAGPIEKGEAETPYGARALHHLIAATRANPALTLSEREHPPKMRRLHAHALEVLQNEGLGGLVVESTPPGATVFVEGRALGVTPLTLEQELPFGRHRVWVALDSLRSATRWVQVGDTPMRLEVDLAFEGALWAEGPGLRLSRGQTVTEPMASKLATMMGASDIALVGLFREGEETWLYGARYSTSSGGTVRRGAVPLASAAWGQDDVVQLARFLSGAEDPALQTAGVPAAVLPAAGPTTAEETDDADSGVFLWAGLGAGALALLLGGVTAGIVALAALSGAQTPAEGRFAVEVVK